MKKLIIVESPAKTRTISKFLGKEYKIISTMGHIKDLPIKELGITMNGTIDIDYVTIENKDDIIANIRKEAETADEIYLAPDPDREGEIIAWHIDQEIKNVVKEPGKIYRIMFNEITKPAVIEAIKNPSNIDIQRVRAQQARRVLDRWVGYEVSPILWQKIAKGLSAGRVQSVTLRLICEREESIRIFKPQEYWTINGLFARNSDQLEASLTHIGKKKIDIKNKKEADNILNQLKKQSYIVDSITDKTRTKNPLPPFMTSTLQQSAFNRLGMPVRKTMQLAQQLYEGIPLDDQKVPIALITYMRTDSLRISETALKQARSFISKSYSKEYLPPHANIYAKKKGKTQDAHEAIRPIDVTLTPEKVKKYLPPDAAKVYTLIWQRFVASQMKSAQYAQRQVVLKGGQFIFKVTGSTLLFDGFLKVYGIIDEEEEKEKKVIIPKDLKAKEPVDLTKVLPKQHFTQPPPRYTEASLIKELEKEGIGRPSTYATILNTIQARSYTTLDNKKRFTPTELGMTVTKLLVKHLPDIINVKFTAHMEEELDKIAQGDLERDTLLREFYKAFKKDLSDFKKSIGVGKKHVETTDILCPKCKKTKLVIRFGKMGEFLGCMNYPDCTFTSNFKRDETGKIQLIQPEGPILLEEKCPECGRQLRQVVGKFGPFIACSGYPKCTYIHREKASFKCLKCKKGNIIKRRWRGGIFWGCDQYPECKFAVFGDIEETPCPLCQSPFLVKKVAKDGKITLFCHNKTCPYKIEKEEATA
ncbi:type I DNA topoisomerase [Candidatus Dependentiae bacterium]|nr:MAG: type I DNA topoisomerase [Candidatus Dependentiae bacterium]